MTNPGVCVLLLLALATPAAAQPRHGFVEGGVLADYDPTLRADQTTTAGVTGSAGVFITSRWSLRAEIDYPQWHGRHRSGENRVLDHLEAFDIQDDGRSPSLSLLVGRDHAQEWRVSFAWVAGLTATRREFRTSGWTERRDLQGNTTNHTEFERRFPSYRWCAGTAGADIMIALTNQLALIPQIRVHTYGGLSEHTSQVFARPRVVLRWQF
jgi:hypothetical protein